MNCLKKSSSSKKIKGGVGVTHPKFFRDQRIIFALLKIKLILSFF